MSRERLSEAGRRRLTLPNGSVDGPQRFSFSLAIVNSQIGQLMVRLLLDICASWGRQSRPPSPVCRGGDGGWISACLIAIGCLFGFFIAGGLTNSRCWADEIKSNYLGEKPYFVGDLDDVSQSDLVYDLLALNSDSNTASPELSVHSITAGELWRYLDSQGIKSTDRLVFVFNVEAPRDRAAVEWESLSLTVPDGLAGAHELALVRDSSDRLVIRGGDHVGWNPEARVEVQLGYDFMARFSAESHELIRLRSELTPGSGSIHRVAIQGNRRYFSLPNIFLLVAFIAFWSLVFWTLRKLTLPTVAPRPTRSVKIPANSWSKT